MNTARREKTELADKKDEAQFIFFFTSEIIFEEYRQLNLTMKNEWKIQLITVYIINVLKSTR